MRHINGQNTHEKYSPSLIIREMQVKTTMRYHLTPVRMTITHTHMHTHKHTKSTNSKCLRWCGEERTLLTLLWNVN